MVEAAAAEIWELFFGSVFFSAAEEAAAVEAVRQADLEAAVSEEGSKAAAEVSAAAERRGDGKYDENCHPWQFSS